MCNVCLRGRIRFGDIEKELQQLNEWIELWAESDGTTQLASMAPKPLDEQQEVIDKAKETGTEWLDRCERWEMIIQEEAERTKAGLAEAKQSMENIRRYEHQLKEKLKQRAQKATQARAELRERLAKMIDEVPDDLILIKGRAVLLREFAELELQHEDQTADSGNA